MKFRWEEPFTLETRRQFLKALENCTIKTVPSTWFVEAAQVVGVSAGAKGKAKAEPGWVRLWSRAGWAIPRSIRCTAFEPAFEDFRADYYRVSATTGGRCDRAWMHIAFAVQFAFMVLACFRIASISWITSGVMKLLRPDESSSTDTRETIE